MRLAKLTLQAISDAIDSDGGTVFRALEKKYLPMMDDAYEPSGPPFRKHLGVSGVGKECARILWYNFRWAAPPAFESRILRLFNRGHLEEARFLAMLEMIGMQIWSGPEEGGQFKVKGYKGHFGSALDGILQGCTDLPPGTPCLAEFKTSSEKEFNKVVSNGCKEAKWEHYVQQQVCMGAYQLPFALYMVVNKNNDDLYAEIIEFDPAIAQRYNDRAAQIIEATEPPMKISKVPSWWQCSFCDYKQVCHFNEPANRNCRTCIYSSPTENGQWVCSDGEDTSDITFEDQLAACEGYTYNDKFNFPV